VAQCKSCGEDVDELVTAKVNGKKQRVCESCADLAGEEQAILEDSEAAVQNMMGFRGRR
jgi:ribosome-binding protein aMBF1 (putative translation factor)